ncbi:PMT-domain-containing protein [Nadsonia fulvescens var. elongata DSM 6958]|uniref:Dolichyl-phosphate-mannose--protein mannosyltransferase n=1 Tax=Nadsonia fulvescens var. elongata DSM 6958 TaxID=857566 RepID=A0A1E3PFW6_9ASCO|nr:PMT-domain-containing protein [Nadsonia fulvescens var. elongata DSM 6958]
MSASSVASGVDRGSIKKRHDKRESRSASPEVIVEDNEITKKATTDTTTKASKCQSTCTLLLSLESYIMPIIFTGLSIWTRLHGIGRSTVVTWDEAHFGKFGSYYITGEYYFDVHPPLGKMLCGLSGWIANFNGTFNFESGHQYPEDVDFVTMRTFNAWFNILCVPVAYFTAKELKFKLPAVWFITLMMLLEHSYIVLGKFILLDSMLALFTFTTLYCLAKFHNLQNQSFTAKWWTWSTLLGLSIGCVCSVKMVGLFITAVVGVYTVADLWIKFGDVKMPYKTYALHWISRIMSLIVIPLLVFLLCFKIHFALLYRTGTGDSNMSSLFQANLVGSDVGGGPMNVAFGSQVTFKSQANNGGLLHSHIQTYPEGSGQQQVTTYHHKDTNNNWQIERKRYEPSYKPEDEIAFLKDQDVIRILHPSTGRNLHTHEVKAPLAKGQWEVSCYGNNDVGDEKDNWIVEIVNEAEPVKDGLVHPLTTTIRLKSAVLGCYLTGHGNNLPQWGFRQGEISCDPKAKPNDRKTWWNVENHWNDRLPASVDRKLPKTSFLKDFIHLNIAQMASNNALIPDADKQDNLSSDAWEWPTLHVGLRLCGWGGESWRYFLLGSPFNTWGSSIAVILFMFASAFYLVRWQRKCGDFNNATLEHYFMAGVIPFLGWVFHYFPFIVMSRVTYVHHYLPALYFAVIIFAFMVELILWRANKYVSGAVYAILYAGCIGVFWHMAPICMGMIGDFEKYKKLEWLSTWNIT